MMAEHHSRVGLPASGGGIRSGFSIGNHSALGDDSRILLQAMPASGGSIRSGFGIGNHSALGDDSRILLQAMPARGGG